MNLSLDKNKYITYNNSIDNYHDHKVLIFLLIIFFISPFTAFLLAVFSQAKKNSSYVIYFLFGLIFAWHMAPTGSSRYDDLEGIIGDFISINKSSSDIYEDLIAVITFNPDAPKEWYGHAMIWVTKNFSKNYHFYFLFCAVPWLFFELSSLHRITSDKKFTQSLICIVILILFVAPRDIISLQNPRFTTGTWAAIFGTLGFFLSNKKIPYLLCILITPLIHSAFWFYIIAFIGGMVMKSYPKISILLLYASIPFSFLSYDLLFSIDFTVLPLPTVMTLWINNYLSEEKYSEFILQEGASGFHWVSTMFSFIMKCAYLIVPLYIIKYRDKISNNAHLWNLCSYFIFFFALVSFIQFVPVLGERFYWLIRILAIFIWFKAIYPKHNWVIWLIFIGCSWDFFKRYFYKGAVSSSVPTEIFWESLPMAIMDGFN